MLLRKSQPAQHGVTNPSTTPTPTIKYDMEVSDEDNPFDTITKMEGRPYGGNEDIENFEPEYLLHTMIRQMYTSPKYKDVIIQKISSLECNSEEWECHKSVEELNSEFKWFSELDLLIYPFRWCNGGWGDDLKYQQYLTKLMGMDEIEFNQERELFFREYKCISVLKQCWKEMKCNTIIAPQRNVTKLLRFIPALLEDFKFKYINGKDWLRKSQNEILFKSRVDFQSSDCNLMGLHVEQLENAFEYESIINKGLLLPKIQLGSTTGSSFMYIIDKQYFYTIATRVDKDNCYSIHPVRQIPISRDGILLFFTTIYNFVLAVHKSNKRWPDSSIMGRVNKSKHISKVTKESHSKPGGLALLEDRILKDITNIKL